MVKLTKKAKAKAAAVEAKKEEAVVVKEESKDEIAERRLPNLGSMKGVQVIAIKDAVVNRIAYKEVTLVSGVSCLMSAEELEAGMDKIEEKEEEAK